MIKNSEVLTDYFKPAELTDIFYGNEVDPTKKYKGIINPNTGQLLSIVSNKYKLIKNEELITKLLDTLEKTDCKYYIEPSHSFVSDKRMRLQLKFPDLSLRDSESNIPFSLFIHNSYDASERVRIIAGAIRGICSNGMIFGKTMQLFYHKHYQAIDVDQLKRKFDQVYNMLPDVQEKINALERIAAWQVNSDMIEKVGKIFGKPFIEENKIGELVHEDLISAWALYNLLTYHISHNISLMQRASYQQKISRLYNL